jgi:hypothetical protein
MTDALKRAREAEPSEAARKVASEWCYAVYSWRGRSAAFMQAQVNRLARKLDAWAQEARLEEHKLSCGRCKVQDELTEVHESLKCERRAALEQHTGESKGQE